MTETRDNSWFVRAPASSANLGAGFDVLGMALDLYADCGLGQAPADAQQIDAHHPGRIAFEALGGTGPMWMRCNIPMGRGLGFSGAARVSAAALGAVVIERHFTIDKELPGPDHSTSSNPEELTALVEALRLTSSSLGKPGKFPHHSEAEFMNISRKSFHAARRIPKGKVLQLRDVCLLRPGSGISPFRLGHLIGSTASRDLSKGDLIRDEDIDWLVAGV